MSAYSNYCSFNFIFLFFFDDLSLTRFETNFSNRTFISTRNEIAVFFPIAFSSLSEASFKSISQIKLVWNVHLKVHILLVWNLRSIWRLDLFRLVYYSNLIFLNRLYYLLENNLVIKGIGYISIFFFQLCLLLIPNMNKIFYRFCYNYLSSVL